MYVQSTVKQLAAVLKEIKGGELRIPNLQRQFVWSADRMLKLFDSIRRGYPIGSILIWESDQEYPSREEVGPIKVSPPPQRRAVAYLLDGQQRLTTLLGCLYLPDASGGRRNKWRMAYRADVDTFAVARSRPGPSDVPVKLFMDGFEMSKYLSSSNFNEQEFRRTQQVANIFLQYQIPVITLKDASLEEAVDVFGRLNTLGKSLTAPELASALSHGRAAERPFDMDERFSEILEVLQPYGFGDLSRTTLLRALLATLGEKDIYTNDILRVVDTHRSDLSQALTTLGTTLEKAVAFLKQEVGVAGTKPNVGVAGTKSLAYGMQMVILSEFFRTQPEPTREQRERLADWIWHSSYTVAYAGSSTSVYVNAAVARIRGLGPGDIFDDPHLRQYRALPFPVRYHARSARVRAFLLFLKWREPRSPLDGALLAPDSLLVNGFSDTRRICSEEGEGRELANRVLLGNIRIHSVGEALKRLKLALPAVFKQTLESHLIPEAAWMAFEAGDDATFLRLRREHLIQEERAFLHEGGIELPPLDEPADEELDEPLEAVDSDAEED